MYMERGWPQDFDPPATASILARVASSTAAQEFFQRPFRGEVSSAIELLDEKVSFHVLACHLVGAPAQYEVACCRQVSNHQ